MVKKGVLSFLCIVFFMQPLNAQCSDNYKVGFAVASCAQLAAFTTCFCIRTSLNAWQKGCTYREFQALVLSTQSTFTTAIFLAFLQPKLNGDFQELAGGVSSVALSYCLYQQYGINFLKIPARVTSLPFSLFT